MRVGGNIIWATDFREETETTRHGGGGKGGGGGGGTEVTEYFYFASLAVALCEGPITGIGRIWADGKPMSLDGVTMRVHLGGEDQEPDPFIAAKMGAANTPAYRGTAYVVFEELPLERFGNRLPQLSFEVFRPILDGESAESLVRAVTLIPASGEFAYATEVVRREVGETTSAGERQRRGPCRRHRGRARPAGGLRAEGRVGLARRRLVRRRPARRALPHPPGRRGQRQVDDAGELVGERRRPRLGASRQPRRPGPPGLRRHAVRQRRGAGDPGAEGARLPRHLLPVHPDGRGRRTTSCRTRTPTTPPATGQPAYPWRGRITCSPAAGYAGSADKSAAAGTQVAAFFGDAQPSDFDVDDERVEWDGDPDDWGLRRMILHYAHLCAAAGGVDAFLIGSELRGITQVRSGASSYPAVAELVDLAADVRVDPRVRHQAQLRRRLVGVLRAPPAGRLGRRLLPPRPALGGRRDRLRRHRQLHAARRLARRARPSRRRERRRDHRPRLPARQRRGRRGLRLVLRQRRRPRGAGAHADHRRRRTAGRGCSATRTSAAGGRTRTATARAGSRAARRRRGCRRASRSASPRSAARRSTAARTSRTSSTTRSRPRASCRTSPAAGATTPCSGASSRRRSATGPSRRTTRCRASTRAG